jgi:hypothetical protein
VISRVRFCFSGTTRSTWSQSSNEEGLSIWLSGAVDSIGSFIGSNGFMLLFADLEGCVISLVSLLLRYDKINMEPVEAMKKV